MEFKNDIEHALQALETNAAVLFATEHNWVVAADATSSIAVEQLKNSIQLNEYACSIIYVADERELMQYVATLDLEVFNFLDAQTQPTAILFEHIIGLADDALQSNGAAFVCIAQDTFTKTLLKRFRKPLFLITLLNNQLNCKSAFNNIDATIKNSVAYIAHHKQQEATVFTPLSKYQLVENEYVKLT
jgi:L-threonylcarbamoyladenylate synthase